MKTLLIFLCSLSVAAVGFAQAPAAQTATPPFTSDELDQLLGPVALYPDPLIALILPASTVPSDIVLADRYVLGDGDPSQIPNEPWDDSVKGLTHYPDLLKWLDDNLPWTTQVGTAYLAQPADVMNSIQQLRARAKADGTLTSNAQQQIGMDDAGDITITPTDADTIYMPEYDTDAVYDDDYDALDGAVITYGAGCPVGPWLSYWPDWHHHHIFLGDWHKWRDYRAGAGFADDPASRQWNPNMNRVRAQYQVSNNEERPIIARPRAIAGVTLVQTKHPNSTTNARPGFVSAPRADFTGRGTVTTGRPAVARPVVVAPPVQVQQEPVYTGYGRGSDARAASERGQESRSVIVNQAPFRSAPPPVQSSGGGGGGGGGQQWQGQGRGR